MPFSISGRIAVGADQALEEVLDRRLKEATRQQIERQNAAENAMRQQTIDLQKQEAVDRATNRAEDVKYRQQQDDVAGAEKLYGRTGPGEVSPAIAEALKKSPGVAPLLSQKKILEGVRPIAGTAPLDTSGPQSMNVLEATPAQAKEQLKTVELKRISDVLRGATNEQGRRAAGAEAFGAGLDVPNELLKQTGEEALTQKMADERRANAENDRRSNREFQQQLSLRDRPTRQDLTPGQAFQATRSLRNDYVRETMAAKTVAGALQNMRDAYGSVKDGSSIPAGSEAMVIIWNKILDPNSVVREGEYTRSLQGQAYIKQLESQWQRMNVGGNIKKEELKKFLDLAERFGKNALTSAKDSQRQIDAIADEFKLNKHNITRDYDEHDDSDVANEVGPKEPVARSDAGGGDSLFKQWKSRQPPPPQ